MSHQEVNKLEIDQVQEDQTNSSHNDSSKNVEDTLDTGLYTPGDSNNLTVSPTLVISPKLVYNSSFRSIVGDEHKTTFSSSAILIPDKNDNYSEEGEEEKLQVIGDGVSALSKEDTGILRM